MCYEALVDGSAATDPVRSVLGAERRDAAVNGLEAAALVAAVLLWQGVGPALALAAAVAAVPVGYVLHQVVLLAGIGLLWLRRQVADAGAGPAA